MIIPTSLFESTQDLPLQIFSALEAGEIKEMMAEMFKPNADQSKAITRHNLLEPLYVNIALNYNDHFNPEFKKNEPFKLQACTLVSKVITTLNPDTIKDLF